MEVFKDAVVRYGGPLPLGEYLDPRVLSPTELEERRAALLQRQLAERKRRPEGGGGYDDSPNEGTTTGDTYTQASGLVSTEDTFIERKNFFEAVLSDYDFALVVSFLLGGAAIDEARRVDGATPLHVAVAGSTRPLNDLLHRGRHRRQANLANMGGLSNGNTSAADEEQRLDVQCPNRLIISFLIDNGADVNARALVGGETPLMVACAMQNVKAVNLLLAKGAVPDARDLHGRTCLHYAALHPHMLQTLLVWMGEAAMAALAVETSLLHQVCRLPGTRFSALYLVEQLGLDVKAPENAQQQQQQGPGHASVEGGKDNDEVSVATAAGDRVNGNSNGNGGDTPLHCAVEAGDLALVITLLAKGADPKAVNAATGRTPLDMALAARRTAVSHFLRVSRNVCFLHLHFSLPGALASLMSVLVNQVGLRIVDVESAAMWGPTAQAMGIYSLLTYCATAPKSRVEVLLTKMENVSATATSASSSSFRSLFQLSDLAALQYFAGFVAFLILPQLVILLFVHLFSGFLPNCAGVLVVFAMFLYLKRLDEAAVGCRPLRSLGFFVGVVTMESLCLPLYTTLTYYSYYVFDEEPHAALTLWLIPSAILSAVCGLMVVLLSPGTVSSTAGHRKGIYASIAHAKATSGNPTNNADSGGLPNELVYSIDLPTMVKKPLRAQRCTQTNRVILRYDHYCAYLASPIGAKNHRPFVVLLLALFALFSSFYYYACAYHRMLSGGSSQYTARQHERYINHSQRAAMAPMENLLFSTPYYRFGYMYTQVILPAILFLLAVELYGALFSIARGVTFFDLDHASSESSLYCFTLGDRVYSLFDKGYRANLMDFFLLRDTFTAVQYRVPTMNDHLKKAVEDFQRWQVTGGGQCGCGHGHSHGGGGDGVETAPPQQQQRDVGSAIDADLEDERVRAQDALNRASQEAKESAERAVLGGSSVGGVHGNSSGQTPMLTNPPLKQAAAAAANAAASTGQGGVPGLAQHIFQEMIRSGTDDVALAHHSKTDLASLDGEAARTQEEWEQAVQQARSMFAFFRQSMVNSTQAILQNAGASTQQQQQQQQQ